MLFRTFAALNIQRLLSARGDTEWEDFLFEERPNVELLRVAEIGEAEEEAVGDEVAGEVAFEDGRLIMCAVVGLADAVGGVVLCRGVAEGQGDFAGFGGAASGLLVDVEQAFGACGIEVFGDGVLRLSGALQEGVERPVEGRFAGAIVTVNKEVAAFEWEGELTEGFEVGDLDFVETGLQCFGFLSAFRAFDSSFLMLSTDGSSSGMVPPSSLIVWRTLAPTSRCAWLALALPVIFSRRSLSSAWVARKRLAASSVLPM